MELDNLGSADSLTITATRLPGASSQSDQALRRSKPLFSPIGCAPLRFDQRLADLLPDPDRASQSEVEAPEIDDE
jgi:hypothetical protein